MSHGPFNFFFFFFSLDRWHVAHLINPFFILFYYDTDQPVWTSKVSLSAATPVSRRAKIFEKQSMFMDDGLPKKSAMEHVIKASDTLQGIAIQYGIKVWASPFICVALLLGNNYWSCGCSLSSLRI